MTDPVASGKPPAAQDPPPRAGGAWAAFRHPAFTVLWSATVALNIGTWMYNAACAWLMTSLSPGPLLVAMVQVAGNLPMFLLAVPAGALSDIVDRRRLLLVGESTTTILSAIFAACVALRLMTPAVLLLFIFLIGAGGALAFPSWEAIVPQLVPKEDLAPAITANGVGINISRALGPAIGGALIVAGGVAVPFWINAVSNVATVGALRWWHPARRTKSEIPPERFRRAMRAGWRYARNNRHVRATMIRAAVFVVVASAYWALLPLVARRQIAGGPGLYGALLGCIGSGAVIGALTLPRLRARLSPDRVLAAATVGTAVALVLFGLAHDVLTAVVASVVAGACWIAAVATLNVSAQVVLPNWVRGRGLALYAMTLFGAMSLGSAWWGQIATWLGLPRAHFLAAAGALIAIPAARRWKVQAGPPGDLTPALSWPTPTTTASVEADRGPVLVTVEYVVDPANRHRFLEAIERLSGERRRDGAYEWTVFEDAAQNGRFLETFLVDSWLEHLRQHERVTNADRLAQEAVDRFHTRGTPVVTHFLAATPDDAPVSGQPARTS